MYAPKLKFSDDKSRPKPLSKHPFAWIKFVLKCKEDEYLDKSGLDAVVYIRFIAMCRNIFAILSVLGVLVILPINVVYNKRSPLAPSLSFKDAFSLTTPILISGDITIAHVTLAYIFDLIICFFLWTNYEHIIKLRRSLYVTEEYQNALFMRTLMLTEIPKKYSKTDQGLIELLKQLKIQRPIQNASVGRDLGQLNKLMDQYNKTVLKFESVLAKYLKNPTKLPATRPVIKPFKEDREFNIGGKIDAIDYLSQRMQKLESQIFHVRETLDTNKTLPYGFVSYKSVEDCHIVAQANSKKFRKLDAQLAPRPEDIIWENIILSKGGRKNKQLWGNVLFIILTILWIVPNAFIGAFLSQMSRIGTLWPAFNVFMIRYPVLFSILQGIIAPIITSLIFLILPAIMRRMSHWQGKVTKRDRELDVTKKLYTFFVFNNIFVFTVFSVVWGIVADIIKLVDTRSDLNFDIVMREINIAVKLSTAIMGASSFWVMYILRVNFGAVLDLLQLFSLVLRGFQLHFMSPTPRQQMLWTAPQHFNFAAYYNWSLFYSTIALCFAMIQPLVLVAVALYFSLDYLYKKYGLMYIFVTKAETDGIFWPHLFNYFLFATIFGNSFLFVVVWVQGGWRIAVVMAPLLPILIAFKIISNKKQASRFHYFIPTEEERNFMESRRTRSTLSDASSTALARRYKNPVIDCNLMVPMIHSKAKHLIPQIAGLNSNIFGDDNSEEDAEFFRSLDDDNDTEYHPGGPGKLINDINSKFKRLSKYKVQRRPVNQGGAMQRKSIMDCKFDIIEDEDLNYEHLRQLENASPANPYIANNGSPDPYVHDRVDSPFDPAVAQTYSHFNQSSTSLIPHGAPSYSVAPSEGMRRGYNEMPEPYIPPLHPSASQSSLQISPQQSTSLYPTDTLTEPRSNLQGSGIVGQSQYSDENDRQHLLSHTMSIDDLSNTNPIYSNPNTSGYSINAQTAAMNSLEDQRQEQQLLFNSFNNVPTELNSYVNMPSTYRSSDTPSPPAISTTSHPQNNPYTHPINGNNRNGHPTRQAYQQERETSPSLDDFYDQYDYNNYPPNHPRDRQP